MASKFQPIDLTENCRIYFLFTAPQKKLFAFSMTGPDIFPKGISTRRLLPMPKHCKKRLALKSSIESLSPEPNGRSAGWIGYYKSTGSA